MVKSQKVIREQASFIGHIITLLHAIQSVKDSPYDCYYCYHGNADALQIEVANRGQLFKSAIVNGVIHLDESLYRASEMRKAINDLNGLLAKLTCPAIVTLLTIQAGKAVNNG